MTYVKKTLEYDKADPLSIEKYSQKLIGKTFGDVMRADAVVLYRETIGCSIWF